MKLSHLNSTFFIFSFGACLHQSASAFSAGDTDPSDEPNRSGRIGCPFSRKGERQNLPSYGETKKRRMEWERLPEVRDFSPKYKPGKKNPGEAFCSTDDDHKFCNHVNGDWGDAMPKDDEYCINLLLEFQDPAYFEYGSSGMNDNTTAFNALFHGVLSSLPEEGWMIAGGTSGLPMGDLSTPWPFASIIWKNGNEHAKPWISALHRPMAQTTGLWWGWVFHGHYKLVKCNDVWPTLEANDLSKEKFDDGKFLQQEGNNYANLWNAFVDMESYHEDFYKDACMVGPCPGDNVATDDSSSSSTPSKPFAPESIVSWLRFW